MLTNCPEEIKMFLNDDKISIESWLLNKILHSPAGILRVAEIKTLREEKKIKFQFRLSNRKYASYNNVLSRPSSNHISPTPKKTTFKLNK